MHVSPETAFQLGFPHWNTQALKCSWLPCFTQPPAQGADVLGASLVLACGFRQPPSVCLPLQPLLSACRLSRVRCALRVDTG